MPKVNKMRVTNVKLDKNLKVIGNETWDLRGNNTVFILENGGGKTSVIQLVHQVITPNITIQGRAIADTVAKRSTFHVAIEWQSDDEERPTFITGFSFYNHGNKINKTSNPYDYISYIYEQNGEEFTIEDLPFIVDDKINSIFALESELKSLPAILCFKNKVRDYTRELENFGIFQSEWMNIAKVNGDEGGVDGFFNKSRTVETLISRLLVPSLEGSLYETKEESASILTTFKKHKETLMNLPKMEKSIEDFKIIQEHSTLIVDASEEFGVARKNLLDIKNKMGSLHKTVDEKQKEDMKLVDESNEELNDIEIQTRDLNYKIDSFKVHQKRKEIEEVKEKAETLESVIVDKEKDVAFYQNKVKEQRAAKHYTKYQEHKLDKNKEEAKYKLMDMDKNEKWTFFQETLDEVSSGNTFLYNEQKQVLEDKTKEINQTKSEISTSNDKLKNSNKQLLEVSNKKSVLDTEIKSYDKDKNNLISLLGVKWKVKLEDTQSVLEDGVSLGNAELNLNKVNKSFLETEKNEMKEQIIKFDYAIKETTLNLKNEIENQSLFEDRTFSLNNHISSLLAMNSNKRIFIDKEQIWNKMNLKLNGLKTEIFEINVQLKHLQADKEFLIENGYTIHPELKQVKDELYRKGFDSILGVEYLLNTSISKEEKQKIVDANPMLVFSLVFENNEFNKLKRTLEKMKQKLSIPIVLIAKEALNSREEKGSIISLENNSYIFNQFNNRLTKEDWAEYREELIEKINERSVRKEQLKMDNERFKNLKKEMTIYYEKYDEKTEKNVLANIEKLQQELDDIEKVIEETNTNIIDLNSSIIDNENERTKLENKLMEDSLQLQQFISFKEKFVGIEDIKVDREKTKVEADELEKLIGYLTTVISSLSKENETSLNELTHINKKITLLENDKKELQLVEAGSIKTINENKYEQIKEVLKQRGREISSEDEKRKETEERITRYQKHMDGEEKELSYIGYTLDFFEKNNIGFDQNQLSEYEFQFDDHSEQLNEQKVALTEAKSNINGLEKIVEHLQSEIEKNFDKEESFEYEVDPAAEFNSYKQELKRCENSRNKIQEKVTQLNKLINDYSYALESLEAIKEEIADKRDVPVLNDEEWDQQTPLKTFRKLEIAHKKLVEEVKKKEIRITAEIQKMIAKINDTNNQQLKTMALKLKAFIETNTKDDEQLISIFVKLIEAVDGYKKAAEIQRNELKNNEAQIIDMMYKRSEEMHGHIRELEKSSYIEIDGERYPTIKVNWPKEETADALYNLEFYIRNLIEELKVMELKGETQDEMDKYLNRELKMENILNNYAKISRCNLRVLKSRNKLLSSHKDYILWDEAASWSGGEKHTFQITMFIAFNTLLRKKKMARDNVSKFLILDNPFGKASSEHIVSPMVEIAKKTNTQLFCLTDIRNSNILQSFETVISNKYILQLGVMMMNSEVEHKGTKIDSLIYNG